MDVTGNQPLAGQKVTVMGLGSLGGGEGTAKWLLEQGAAVTVTDTKTEAELRPVVDRLKRCGEIEWRLGGHSPELFTQTDMVVRNPAVRRDSEYLQMAQEHGVPVEMDSSLLLRYCPTRKIIGVTGSKGKTTCARWTGHLLAGQARRVWVVGTDGQSLLGGLGQVEPDDILVAELSSWRLEALIEHSLSLQWAVVTSLYRDHLNTYSSLEEYWEVKRSVADLQRQGETVLLNYDDRHIREWRPAGSGRVWWFSAKELPAHGIGAKDGKVVSQINGHTAELVDLEDIPAFDETGCRNALPGIMLASQFGATPGQIKAGLGSMKALPHRLELVAEQDGVMFVNDSAATIPEASCAALAAFKQRPVVLIAGGNDKGLEFEGWGRCVAGAEVEGIVWLKGTATDAMQAAAAKAGTDAVQKEAGSMAEAVAVALAYARRGSVVLLSPGATSFGSFRNEFERGDAFRAEVLKITHGER